MIRGLVTRHRSKKRKWNYELTQTNGDVIMRRSAVIIVAVGALAVTGGAVAARGHPVPSADPAGLPVECRGDACQLRPASEFQSAQPPDCALAARMSRIGHEPKRQSSQARQPPVAADQRPRSLGPTNGQHVRVRTARSLSLLHPAHPYLPATQRGGLRALEIVQGAVIPCGSSQGGVQSAQSLASERTRLC